MAARHAPLRAIIALVFGLLLVAAPIATWWAVSPYATMKGIADASYDGDEDAFRAYFDIPALRANALMRAEDQIHSRLGRAPSLQMNDGAIASALMGPVINRALSKRSTDDMVHRKNHVSGREISYVMIRDGPNWFEVRFIAPYPLVLKFHRTWFRWRIVDVWIEGSEKPVFV